MRQSFVICEDATPIVIARNITSCTFIARSSAAFGYASIYPPLWMYILPAQSGQIICYLNFAYGAKKLVEKPSGNPDRID